jgi:hypothetical protein
MITGLLLAGCPESNTLDDDGGAADSSSPDLDASIDAPDPEGPDAVTATPDVFVCPDGDGDGETDARCGGTDCDDEDAMLSSTQGPCGTPTAIHRCVAGAAADVECTGETPYCDARVGACVANACGDHVLHDGEACDDADTRFCRPNCRIGCVTESQCPAGQICHMGYDAAGGAAPVCGTTNPEGAPNGSLCTTDAECHSGYCDRYMGRCGIVSHDSCVGPNTWNDSQLLYSSAVLRPEILPVCKYECLHRSECRDDAECVLALALGTRYVLPTCVPVVRGPAELGEACSSDRDCQSLLCVLDRCTQVCRDDADCPTALPTCREVDLRDERRDGYRLFPEPRPSDWSSAWPQLCMAS